MGGVDGGGSVDCFYSSSQMQLYQLLIVFINLQYFRSIVFLVQWYSLEMDYNFLFHYFIKMFSYLYSVYDSPLFYSHLCSSLQTPIHHAKQNLLWKYGHMQNQQQHHIKQRAGSYPGTARTIIDHKFRIDSF